MAPHDMLNLELSPKQIELVTALAGAPRNELPKKDVDMRAAKALATEDRKFVVVKEETVALNGPGQIYFQNKLKPAEDPPAPPRQPRGPQRRTLVRRAAERHMQPVVGDSDIPARDRVLTALAIIEHYIPAEIELDIASPDDGMQFLAYSDSLTGALRKYAKEKL